MGLNLAQIDRLLSEWKFKVDAANQNLLDLYDLPAYQRTTGMGNPPTNLTGISQQKVAEALTAIDRLFQDLELLNNTIESARQLRQKLPSMFISDESLREIERLLIGDSIQMPSIQTPLSQRDLLSPNRQLQAISPDDLLVGMMSAFTIARDTFSSIDLAWQKLESELVAIHQELISLQQLAQQLQVAISPALTHAQTNFTSLQLEIDRDPLGVNSAISRELNPLLNNTRRELELLAQQRQQIQSEIVTANQKLQELHQLNRDSIAAQSESQANITHCYPTISALSTEELAAMSQWLERLISTFEVGTIAPVRVGLTNWTNKLQVYTNSARSALTANRLPLDTRRELRGRLDALKAKALAKQKAEDPILAEVAAQARQVLYTSPTDLNLAIDLVQQYERRLNQQLAC
jgi:hypothetical protein